jgi:hypothetical protein
MSRKIEKGECKKIKTDFEHRAKRKEKNTSNWNIGKISAKIHAWNY